MRVIRRFNGFTIVELLVVISIVAMLLSLLIPSLSKAQETARTIGCASNLKQIDIAAMAFAADNKGFIPQNKSLSWWAWPTLYIVLPYDSNQVPDATTSVPSDMRNWRTGGGSAYTSRMFPHTMMMGGYINWVPPTKTSGTVWDCASYKGPSLRTPTPTRTTFSYVANGYNEARYNTAGLPFNPNNDVHYNDPFFKTPTQRLDTINAPSRSFIYADRVMVQEPYNGDIMQSPHLSDEVGMDWNDGDPNRRWAQVGAAGNTYSVWFHKLGLNTAFYDGSVRFVNKSLADRTTYFSDDIITSLTPQPSGSNLPYVWPVE